MMLIVLRLLSLVYQNVCRIDRSTLPSRYVIPSWQYQVWISPITPSGQMNCYTVLASARRENWLRVWFLTPSLSGILGLYVAEMTKEGFRLAGMADSD